VLTTELKALWADIEWLKELEKDSNKGSLKEAIDSLEDTYHSILEKVLEINAS